MHTLIKVGKMRRVALTVVILAPCAVEGLLSHVALPRSPPVSATFAMSTEHSDPVEVR